MTFLDSQVVFSMELSARRADWSKKRMFLYTATLSFTRRKEHQQWHIVTKSLFPFIKSLNLNRLSEYSVDFPLCQRFSLWIFNGFDLLPSRRRVFARWGPGPGPGPRDPRAKTLRPLGKRSNPLNIQRENRWQRGKSTEYSLKRLRLRDLIKRKTYLGPKTFKNPSKINFGHWI